MNNTYQVVRDFEAALCEYTGAKYAVTVTSCTAALLLAVRWFIDGEENVGPSRFDLGLSPGGAYGKNRHHIEIPSRTYISVPMSIIHAGGRPVFRNENWFGAYQLKPLPVWDAARFFTSGMYTPGQYQCVSFHASKTLGDTQGGAILHDNDEADAWFRRMRFDGRTEGVAPKDDTFREIGFHCYLSPDVAARLLLKLSVLPRHNSPLPNSDYPDLGQMEIFK
jgi:dTDP-4-amino-4,6-dideoxygalactose transaminase